MKVVNYQPYSGGAGPELKQVENNNLFIQQELNKIGISTTREKSEEDYEVEDVVVTSKSGRTLNICYDRWGYVIEGHSEYEEDQVSPETVLKTIQLFMLLFEKSN